MEYRDYSSRFFDKNDAMAKETYCVYRFIDAHGEMIYVGKTKNLAKRMASHSHLSPGCYYSKVIIQYITFETEDDMDMAEIYFIKKYNPKYNTVYANKNLTLNIDELENRKWFDYWINEDVVKSQLQEIRSREFLIDVDVTIEDFLLIYGTLISNIRWTYTQEEKNHPVLDKLENIAAKIGDTLVEFRDRMHKEYPLFECDIYIRHNFRNSIHPDKDVKKPKYPNIKDLTEAINLVENRFYIDMEFSFKHDYGKDGEFDNLNYKVRFDKIPVQCREV